MRKKLPARVLLSRGQCSANHLPHKYVLSDFIGASSTDPVRALRERNDRPGGDV